MIRTRLFGLLIALAAPFWALAPAQAVTSMATNAVTAAAWVDLGAGPMVIQSRSRGQVFIGFGTAAPASTDDAIILNGGSAPLVYDGSSHAWARTVTGATASVIVAPSGRSAYPNGATPVTASSGNVAAAAAVATLPGVANKTTYITGFRCGGSGATAAAVVNITVAGIITGTQTYTMVAVAGATLANNPVERRFEPGIPASAVNTAIVVTMPSLGAGNTNASCNAEGYQL